MIVYVYERCRGGKPHHAEVCSPADDRLFVSFDGEEALERALDWVLDNGHELAGVQAELFADG